MDGGGGGGMGGVTSFLGSIPRGSSLPRRRRRSLGLSQTAFLAAAADAATECEGGGNGRTNGRTDELRRRRRRRRGTDYRGVRQKIASVSPNFKINNPRPIFGGPIENGSSPAAAVRPRLRDPVAGRLRLPAHPSAVCGSETTTTTKSGMKERKTEKERPARSLALTQFVKRIAQSRTERGAVSQTATPQFP